MQDRRSHPVGQTGDCRSAAAGDSCWHAPIPPTPLADRTEGGEPGMASASISLGACCGWGRFDCRPAAVVGAGDRARL